MKTVTEMVKKRDDWNRGEALAEPGVLSFTDCCLRTEITQWSTSMKTWATASSTTDEVMALDVGKVITAYSE